MAWRSTGRRSLKLIAQPLQAWKPRLTLVSVVVDQFFAAHRGHPSQAGECHSCAMLANKDLALEFV